MMRYNMSGWNRVDCLFLQLAEWPGGRIIEKILKLDDLDHMTAITAISDGYTEHMYFFPEKGGGGIVRFRREGEKLIYVMVRPVRIRDGAIYEWGSEIEIPKHRIEERQLKMA